ncbi:MAG: metalloregulator ArsR/SmtB family transcription factor [Gemmatimonadota bacterium]
MKELSRIFKSLSDETRLTIMGLVLHHDHLCVCEVEQILGITQSKASRHLRYLRDAGVLEDEREGLIVNYRLPKNPPQDLSAVVETLRKLLANRAIPEAAPLLVQMREARLEGASASGDCGTRPSASGAMRKEP